MGDIFSGQIILNKSNWSHSGEVIINFDNRKMCRMVAVGAAVTIGNIFVDDVATWKEFRD